MIQTATRNGEVWYHLTNENLSCLLCCNKFGKVELVHLGAPVTMADGDPLRLKAGLGWGCSVVMDDADNSSSMDVLPLLFSDAGHGDFREPSVSVSRSGIALHTDFRCQRDEKLQDVPTSGLPRGRGGETLHLTLQDFAQKLTVHLYITLYPTAIGFSTALTNGGDALTLHQLNSLTADLFGQFDLLSFHGGWIGEMEPVLSPVTAAQTVIESRTGDSSNQHHTGFLLCEQSSTEDDGRVYACNLIYSGNHRSTVQRSRQGLNRLTMGVSPLHFSYPLEKGQTFTAPQAVITCSRKGKNGASQAMHTFVTGHIVPGFWRDKDRPVVYNSWEGCMFSFTERKLLSLATKAAALGCETFVLDDGWFGRRDDDTSSLGDYNEHTKKLPHGLPWLSKKLGSMGLDFGLWFEPEAISPDSDLYRSHSDWALKESEAPLLGRHELLLDLTKPEARDYIVENVSGAIDRSNVKFVKWDMNRHSLALGAKSYDYILGLYDVLHRIFDPRPQVLLEMCSSGGNRFDLGMLYFAPQIWCSDNTDPICRLTIQNSLSYLYPQSTMSAHVSEAPHAQTLRHTPLETRGNVAMMGIYGLELDLAHLVSVEEKAVRAQIAYYKAHRSLFQFGKWTRLPCEAGATCWQVSQKSQYAVGLYHRLVPAAPGYEVLQMRGLDKAKRYNVTSRPQSLRVGQFGSLLKHVLPVELNPNGAILSTADKHYTMNDGQQTLTASGAALGQGVALSPRFTGTGYDANARNQGDFTSQIYLVEEVTP